MSAVFSTLLLLLAGSTASSPGAGAETNVRFMAGRCGSLIFAGRSRTRGCKGRLVSVSYPSGLISFVFADADGRLVSFLGRIAHVAGGQTTIKIGQVTTADPGLSRASAIGVIGSCVYTATPARRNRLECVAADGRSRYSGQFVTTGEAHASIAL